MRRFTALLLAAALGAGAAHAPSAAEQAGSAVRIPDTIGQRLAACAICHGKQGEGTLGNDYYPRLAGKPAEYLYNQLLGFRDRRRNASPIMSYMTSGLSESYLHEIARHFSGLRPPYPPALPAAQPARMALGEAIVRNGLPERDIPACIACHGPALTGMLPGIPGLIGLYPDYIAAQLGAWRGGQRNAIAPDCMARIASRLNGEDMAAVAAWLASRPAAPATPPVAARTVKLPLECGSAPP